MLYNMYHDDAEILVEDTKNDKHKITVKLKNHSIYMPICTYETGYPINLIKKILIIKGPAYLCDEIMREESYDYSTKHIFCNVFGYINKEKLKNKKVLDFGCGCGASAIIISRIMPDASITGVELKSRLLEIALSRAEYYKVGNRVKYFISPNGNSLPKGIGDFDYIFLSAVYEHLLPAERNAILPLLWSSLKPAGILFINQTPFRWFPIETHTTSGLIFINYMPEVIALFYARHFSKRKLSNNSWSTLLRKGIRGGSVREITKILKNHSCSHNILEPKRLGLKDRIDIWYSVLNKSRYLKIKKSLFLLFKLIKISTGHIFLPTLTLAIKKPKDAYKTNLPTRNY